MNVNRRKINYRNLGILAAGIIVIILVICLIFSLLFRGCTSKADASKLAEDKTQQDSSSTSIVTVGEKGEGSTEVNLDNQCGQAIVSFKVRSSDSGEFGDNLLGDSRIKNKSTAKWYAASGDATMNAEVKLANYTSFVLHDIPVSRFNGLVTIKYKDGVGYLEYKPKDSENTISTYQEELKYKDQTDGSTTSAAGQPTDTQDASQAEGAASDDQTADTDETYVDPGLYQDETYINDGTYDQGQYTEDGTGGDYSDGSEYGYDEVYTEEGTEQY